MGGNREKGEDRMEKIQDRSMPTLVFIFTQLETRQASTPPAPTPLSHFLLFYRVGIREEKTKFSKASNLVFFSPNPTLFSPLRTIQPCLLPSEPSTFCVLPSKASNLILFCCMRMDRRGGGMIYIHIHTYTVYILI